MQAQKIHRGTAIIFAVILLFIFGVVNAQDIRSEGIASPPRIAPGETLPLQIRLLNFGSNSPIDVIITYLIIDQRGSTVATKTETVAVQTSASFVHTIAIPPNVESGEYTVTASIHFPGQSTPAVSSYQFTVELKFAGIFLSDLMKFSAVALFASIVALFAVRIVRRTRHGLSAHTYLHVPASERIYYEMVGDMIHEMRLHEGDRALAVARKIPGLEVGGSGEVKSITGNHAEIVAHLVTEYEKTFGVRTNLAFGKNARRRIVSRV